MKRRDILDYGVVLTGTTLLAGCNDQQDTNDEPESNNDEEEGILPEEESDEIAENEEEEEPDPEIELEISSWGSNDQGIDAFYEIINDTDSRALAVPVQLNWDFDVVWAHNIPPGQTNQYDVTIEDDFSQEHVSIREEYLCFEDDIGRQIEADTKMELTERQGNSCRFEISIPDDVEADDIRQFELFSFDLLSQADVPLIQDGTISDGKLIVEDSVNPPYFEPRSTQLERPLTVKLQSTIDESEFTTFPRIPEFSLDIHEIVFSEHSNSTTMNTVVVELTAESDLPAYGGSFGVLQEQDDPFILTRKHEVAKPGGLFYSFDPDWGDREGFIAPNPLSEDVKPTIVAENIIEYGESLIEPEFGEDRIGESTLIEIPVEEELELPINEDTQGFVIYQWGSTVLAHRHFTIVDHLE